MKAEMKHWLSDHGLTALQVAQRAGLPMPTDIWRMLRGGMPMHPNLKPTLCSVYGMTEAEWKEVAP